MTVAEYSEFDVDGNPVRDINFTIPMDSFGKPRENHYIPKQYRWQVNDTKLGIRSDFRRSKAEPL